jgi:N-hydroxyarylamine O-acetyltransferase
MDVDAYLERIGYRGGLAPTAETLRRLHVAHLLAVPFENLSIHAGEPVVLDDASLFDKVVARRRGGFCYELNGLFAALLRALGFRVEMLSAAVAKRGGGFGPEFDHMALLVALEERRLADVGFGDSFVEPLLVDERAEQAQGSRAFRIDEAEGGRLVLLLREAGGEWEPQYRFGLEPHAYEDYEGMCRFHQTSPESHFTRGRVCSRLTPDGRVTLSGARLITTRSGGKEERELAGEDERATALLEHFGISMRGGGVNP